MKRTFFVLAMIFIFGLPTALLNAQTADPPQLGNGTIENPYQITTLSNLYWLSQNSAYWYSHYVQTADIDASETNTWNSGEGWSPIGNGSQYFSGSYDGGGFTISGLYINRPGSSDQAFFGCSNNASLNNIGLLNVNISGSSYVGGLVGFMSSGTISNCYSSGSVSGDWCTGGLVGENHNGRIINSLSNCSVTGNQKTGGLAGQNSNGNISNCYNTGSVGAYDSTGGLVGFNYEGSIYNCYSTGSVSGSSNTGGLLGGNDYGIIINCYWNVESSGQSSSFGGIAKSSTEMQDIYTYLLGAWDFQGISNEAIWNIGNSRNNGYPYLNWQYPLDPAYSGNYIPAIRTISVTDNTSSYSICSGSIVSQGNPPADQYGICWNTTGNPTTSDNVIDLGSPTFSGTFSTNLSNLQSNTTYYVNTYIVSSMGTFYGISANFLTPQIDLIPPIGDGTTDAPYEIANLSNLYWISQNNEKWDKHYLQTADIDASATSTWNNGEGWNPIGNWNQSFSGSYDGGGFTISGLYINRPNSEIQALFGYASSASLSNLGMLSVNISGSYNVGGLVGYTYYGTISNCYSTGTVSGSYMTGGLVGQMSSGTISNCYSTGTVSGSYMTGGLVGYCGSGTISNCYSTGAVSGSSQTAGLVGYQYYGIISNCYSTGAVSGSYQTGGLVGYTYSETISNSFWDIETSGRSYSAGGIGKISSQMQDVYTYLPATWEFKGLCTEGIWNIGNSRNNGYPYLDWQYPQDPALSGNYHPVITTGLVINITTTDALCNATIDFLGSPDAEQYGFCWSTTGNPTTADNVIDLGEPSVTGVYSATIGDLQPNTTYYVNAYIVSSMGAFYGTETSFTTLTMDPILPTGNGTTESPYQIANLSNLYWLSQNSPHWNKHYIQTADIDASATTTWNNGEGWTPIGTNWNQYFSGSYDGGGFTISGLYINRPSSDIQALFGYASSATLSNLGMLNVNISGSNYTGGLVGYTDSGTFSNCYSTGTVSGYQYTGGLVGGIYYGTISNCYSTGTVSGSYMTGGLVGYCGSGTISNCYSTGAVSGSSNYTGGLVGYLESGTISNCYSTGNVSGSYQSGGLVGYTYYGNISNCYSTGTVSGSSYTGGLVGYSDSGTVTNSYWNMESSGQSYSAGGLGKSSSQLQDINTYLSSLWDFKGIGNIGIWNIGNDRNDGYPYLDWQYPLDPGWAGNYSPGIGIQTMTNVTEAGAFCTATIASLGNPFAEQYGICWNTTGNPTTSDSIIDLGEPTALGTFSATLSDLLANTTYYVNAFIVSSMGTYYGNATSFLTLPMAPVLPTGNGTAESPYQIANLSNLYWISQNSEHWDKHYIQTTDIDASATTTWNNGEGWSPIGNGSQYFSGSYDGGGFTISGLYINRPGSESQALFGYANSATLTNLGMLNVNISGNYNTGSLVGYTYSGTISNSYSTGSVSSSSNYTGGLVGQMSSGTISNCYSTGTVSGSYMTGGLVGQMSSGTISNCYSTGNVSGNQYTGGLVGYTNSGTINNSYSTGNVSGNQYTGGLVGYTDYGTISNSYCTGSVSGSWDTGGLIGYNNGGSVNASYWNIESSGQSYSAGGLGRTTVEMTAPSAVNCYENWDFSNIWASDVNFSANNGYPYLRTILYLQTPLAVINPNPADQALSIAIGTALNWELDPATSLSSTPNAYKLCLGTDYPPTNVVNMQNISNGYYPPALAFNTTYYWQIIPVNAIGNAENCPIWSFTTIVNALPAQNVVAILNPGTVNLSWELPLGTRGNKDPSILTKQIVDRTSGRSPALRTDPSFHVYRLHEGQESNEAEWQCLTTNPITATQFSDTEWTNISDGMYLWAVKAVYPLGVMSVPSFSNQILNAPEVTSVIPEIALTMNGSITLSSVNTYFSSGAVTFSVTNNVHVNWEVTPEGFLRIYPEPDWFGAEYIQIRGMDVYGNYAEQGVRVVVTQAYSNIENCDHAGAMPTGYTQAHSGTTLMPWQAVQDSGTDYSLQCSATTSKTANERLVTGSVNLASYRNIQVSYDCDFLPSTGATGSFAYTINGVTWVTIETVNSAFSGVKSFTIPALDGKSSVKLRWTYLCTTANNGSQNYWKIDNISIAGLYTDTTAPAQISGFQVSGWNNAGLCMSWNPSTETYFKEYRIYYSTDATVDSGDALWTAVEDPALNNANCTQTTITGLSQNEYWLTIVAVDHANLVSPLSATIHALHDIVPPVFSAPVPTGQPLPEFVSFTNPTIGCTVTDQALNLSTLRYRVDANQNGIYDPEETWQAVPARAATLREALTFSFAHDFGASGIYHYEFRVEDMAQNVAYSGLSSLEGIDDDWTVRIDVNPPTQITDFQVTGLNDVALSVSWSPCTETYFKEYRIYYSTDADIGADDALWTVIDDPALNNLNCNQTTISGLLQAEYWLAIIAVDHANLVSPLSDILHVWHDTILPVFSAPLPTGQPLPEFVSITNPTIGCTVTDQALNLSTLRYRVDANQNGIYDPEETWQAVPVRAATLREALAFSFAHDFGASGIYHYEFRVEDIMHNIAYSGLSSLEGIEDDWTVRIDLNPPAQVSGLFSSFIDNGSIQLVWNSLATDNSFAVYEVYYATHSGVTDSDLRWDETNDATMAQIGSGIKTTTVTGLEPGTRYYFRVQARNVYGNVGIMSEEISAITLGGALPSAPQQLEIVRNGDDIILSWQAVTTDVLGMPIQISYYEIHAGLEPDFEPSIDSMIDVSLSNSFVHTDVVPYLDRIFYRVIAVQGDPAAIRSKRK